MESTKHKEIVKTAVMIPSLNPDCLLVKYVKKLIEKGIDTIIIIDDGSDEDTRHYFKELNAEKEVTVLHHAVNQGKGRALKTGFNYFLNTYSKDEKIGVVTADADGQHSVEDTLKVVDSLQNNDALILGTRNFNERNVPFKSRFGNRITTCVFSLLYGKKIQDTQTGLRGIPYDFISKCLQLPGERFEYEIAMLIEAVREKITIIEELIQTIYIDSNRTTHFSAVKDSIKIYKVIFGWFLKFSCSSLMSSLIDIVFFHVTCNILFNYLDSLYAIIIATALARICSSLINFIVNKQYVFKSKENIKKTAIKYYALSVVQLLISGVFVAGIFKVIRCNSTLIKIIIDTILFFFSFHIQRLWVFKEETEC